MLHIQRFSACTLAYARAHIHVHTFTYLYIHVQIHVQSCTCPYPMGRAPELKKKDKEKHPRLWPGPWGFSFFVVHPYLVGLLPSSGRYFKISPMRYTFVNKITKLVTFFVASAFTCLRKCFLTGAFMGRWAHAQIVLPLSLIFHCKVMWLWGGGK